MKPEDYGLVWDKNPDMAGYAFPHSNRSWDIAYMPGKEGGPFWWAMAVDAKTELNHKAPTWQQAAVDGLRLSGDFRHTVLAAIIEHDFALNPETSNKPNLPTTNEQNA